VSGGWVPPGMMSGPGPGTPTAGPGVKGEKGSERRSESGWVWMRGRRKREGKGKEEEEGVWKDDRRGRRIVRNREKRTGRKWIRGEGGATAKNNRNP
jgi:hypothetical protein